MLSDSRFEIRTRRYSHSGHTPYIYVHTCIRIYTLWHSRRNEFSMSSQQRSDFPPRTRTGVVQYIRGYGALQAHLCRHRIICSEAGSLCVRCKSSALDTVATLSEVGAAVTMGKGMPKGQCIMSKFRLCEAETHCPLDERHKWWAPFRRARAISHSVCIK
jgi:hypothetical protein